MYEYAEDNEEVINRQENFTKMISTRCVGKVLESFRSPVECAHTDRSKVSYECSFLPAVQTGHQAGLIRSVTTISSDYGEVIASPSG